MTDIDSDILFSAGNYYLHLMTSDKPQRLRVDLADFEGGTRYAEYDYFSLGSPSERYRLATLGTYIGTAGNYSVVIYYTVLR